MNPHKPVDSRIYDVLWALANNVEQDILEFATEQFSKYTDCQFFIISEVSNRNVANVVSARFFGEIQQHFQYTLNGTPCDNVISKEGSCFYLKEVSKLFPEDKMLADFSIESYLGSPLFDKNNNVIGLFIVMSQNQITEKSFITQLFEVFKNRIEIELDTRIHTKATKVNKARYKKLYDESFDAILILEPSQLEIIDCNFAAEKLFKLTKPQLSNKRLASFMPKQAEYNLMYSRADLLTKNKNNNAKDHYLQTITLNTQNINILAEYNMYALSSMTDSVIAISLRDITERIRLEQKNLHLATIDHLTKIKNRMAFQAEFNALLKNLEPEYQLAFLLVDIDEFKKINDILGHNAGDMLLREISDEIQNCLSEKCLLGRLGGDEFGIVYIEKKYKFSPEKLADLINKKISNIHQVANYSLNVRSSIGISIYNKFTSSQKDLFIQADLAMYEAKKSGANKVSLFSEKLNQEYINKIYIEQILKSQELFKKLKVFYQPIIDIEENKIVGFEALLRWVANDGRVETAAQFIRIAEMIERFHDIGSWIIQKAFNDFANHISPKFPATKLSINISPKQLSNVELPAIISNIVQQNFSLASQLIFEITEEVVIDNFEAASKAIETIRALGASFSIDDFGVGHSSFARICQLHFDYLKVDKLFLRPLCAESVNQQVYQTLLLLSDRLNTTLIQEGVETIEQLEFIKAQGCRYVQGFYFFKPMPLEQILLLA